MIVYNPTMILLLPAPSHKTNMWREGPPPPPTGLWEEFWWPNLTISYGLKWNILQYSLAAVTQICDYSGSHLIIIIICNISPLHHPWRKSNLSLSVGLSISLSLTPLAVQIRSSAFPWLSVATAHTFQPLCLNNMRAFLPKWTQSWRSPLAFLFTGIRLSQELSYLSGLNPSGPPWCSLGPCSCSPASLCECPQNHLTVLYLSGLNPQWSPLAFT